MEKDAKIYISGHRGVAGSAVHRLLESKGYHNIIVKTHRELDLTIQNDVSDFFMKERPDYVFFFAAKRTSILNKESCPIDACLDTIQMTTNVLKAAHDTNVKRLLLASSGLAYPTTDQEFIGEDTILTGAYEKTNEPYSLGKIVGAKLCEYFNKQYKDQFFSVMPCVFFGPGDNFNIGEGPVLPTLIHRFHNAKMNGDKEFVLWGTGKPMREYMYSGNVADGCVFLMKNGAGGRNYNIGNGGKMISIMELAQMIKKVVGYEGEIITDPSKPDGAKLIPLDSSHLMNMGWRPTYSMEQGIKETYDFFLHNVLMGGL